MIRWLAADESCWLPGELVLQYDSSAAADKRCWLLGELVVQYELRRDALYDMIGWLLTRAAGYWLINKGRASCERSYLIRVGGLLRRGFVDNRGQCLRGERGSVDNRG